jgi:hypothetical protein
MVDATVSTVTRPSLERSLCQDGRLRSLAGAVPDHLVEPVVEPVVELVRGDRAQASEGTPARPIRNRTERRTLRRQETHMEKASVASTLRPGLRSYFDLARTEPLPDALADLVHRLRTSEQTPKPAQGTQAQGTQAQGTQAGRKR